MRNLACTLLAGGVLTILSASATADDWQEGYVFAGVSGGNYNVYDNAGNFIETINNGLGGFTTGAAFNGGPTAIYTTDFSSATAVVFDLLHPHNILQSISSAPFGGAAMESVVFDALGNFYTGHAGGNGDLILFDSTGTYVTQFDPIVDRGTDWIDLSADQATMFYTGEGRTIRRFDVAGNAQLADFATLPGSGNAYAFRLLGPSFDGSDGLIVADSVDLKRLDSTGAVIQTYNVAGQGAWFALNLDPNGTSFWAGDFSNDNFFRFDIASGAVEVGPISAGGGGTLFGLAVLGEIAGGNLPPKFDDPTPCDEIVMGTVSVPLSFDVCASDENTGDIVTLDVVSLPAGATMTPTLPLDGNPVCSTFDWTPTNSQQGTHIVVFTATDRAGNVTTCSVQIEIAECNLLWGGDGQPSSYDLHGIPIPTLVSGWKGEAWVTMQDIPEIPFSTRGLGMLGKSKPFTLQIWMYNPEIFPENPTQWTQGIKVQVIKGQVEFLHYGKPNGMRLDVEYDAEREVLIPTFTINGL